MCMQDAYDAVAATHQPTAEEVHTPVELGCGPPHVLAVFPYARKNPEDETDILVLIAVGPGNRIVAVQFETVLVFSLKLGTQLRIRVRCVCLSCYCHLASCSLLKLHCAGTWCPPSQPASFQREGRFPGCGQRYDRRSERVGPQQWQLDSIIWIPGHGCDAV